MKQWDTDIEVGQENDIEEELDILDKVDDVEDYVEDDNQDDDEEESKDESKEAEE